MIYPWLQTQWQHLLSQHQQQRLPHALLIEGPAGLGKLALAEDFAALVLCESNGQSACGVCRSCVLLSAGNHPDYFKLQLEEDAKNIKIEAVRELIANLEQHAHQGGYQVAILQAADKLNRAAANALLKTLEEPAGKVLIILVSDQSAALPATLLSRCQKIICRGCDSAETKLWLERNLTKPVASLDWLLQAVDYAPLKAAQLAEANYLLLRDQWLWQLVALKNQELSVLKVVADWTKQDSAILLTSLQLIGLDMLRLSLGVKYEPHSEYSQNLMNLQARLGLAQCLYFLRSVQRTTELAKAANNLNWQMLLENLLLNF
ncbi:MAG TPA: DNA polymerase III subunit delta' [Coxiellaceae bacterium]|nr:DNA polymerase III subunit delta' [Coxiellaceae bacterium]